MITQIHIPWDLHNLVDFFIDCGRNRYQILVIFSSIKSIFFTDFGSLPVKNMTLQFRCKTIEGKPSLEWRFHYSLSLKSRNTAQYYDTKALLTEFKSCSNESNIMCWFILAYKIKTSRAFSFYFNKIPKIRHYSLGIKPEMKTLFRVTVSLQSFSQIQEFMLTLPYQDCHSWLFKLEFKCDLNNLNTV